jgi:hypothetical protein
MGPDGVIGIYPALQLLVVFLQGQADILNLIKFLPVSTVRSLHIALELRGADRNNEKPNLSPLASLLKMFFELRTSVDLDGPDGEGKLSFQVFQE